MAYDTKIEQLKADLIAAIGGGGLDALHLSELWNRYLTSVGEITGTLLDRMARDAASLGIPLSLYAAGQISPDLGPNIAPNILGGDWTTILSGASTDGSGLHYVATDAGTISHAIDTEDNATYRLEWTQVFTSGSHRWQLYGDTSAHLGQTTSYTSSGSFSEDVQTIAAGSLNNTIRSNANSGGAGSNTLDLTALSVRKVL